MIKRYRELEYGGVVEDGEGELVFYDDHTELLQAAVREIGVRLTERDTAREECEHLREGQVKRNKEVQDLIARLLKAADDQTMDRSLLLEAADVLATLPDLGAMMMKHSVDVNICTPGNHGGAADMWLVTVERPDGRNLTEHMGLSLDDALKIAIAHNGIST